MVLEIVVYVVDGVHFVGDVLHAIVYVVRLFEWRVGRTTISTISWRPPRPERKSWVLFSQFLARSFSDMRIWSRLVQMESNT